MKVIFRFLVVGLVWRCKSKNLSHTRRLSIYLQHMADGQHGQDIHHAVLPAMEEGKQEPELAQNHPH